MSSTPSHPTSSLIPPRGAMVASQRAHIDDLVKRNRILDQNCKKLEEDLLREESRSKDAVKQIQTRWHDERIEWREGCDTLLACHRIAQLRTAIEVDNEVLAAVKQEDALRKERLARLQRDYKITMFQVKEMELDGRIAELEDDLVDLQAENEAALHSLTEQHRETTQKLRKKCADFASEVAHLSDALSAAQRERDDTEEKSSLLREEIAQLRVTAESTASKLERTTLQLDGAQSANAELERLNDELKRSDGEIKRQLDKWQSLENKGGAEVEAMRKRRIELEVQVKELENRLGGANKREKENTSALEKERVRVSKLKEILGEWRQATEEAQEDAERYKAEAGEAEKQVAKAQQQIAKLKAELDERRAKAKISAPKPSRQHASDTAEEGNDETPLSENEVAEEIAKSPTPAVSKPRPRPKVAKVRSNPVPKPASLKQSGDDGDAKSQESTSEDDNDLEVTDKSAKAKGKQRTTATVEDSDVEIAPGKGGRQKATGKGKRDTKHEPREAEKRKKAQRAGSIQPDPSKDEEEGDQPTKKKKRKINIFGAAQDTTFAWDQFGSGVNDLGIPTMLSPVKQTEPVQSSSNSILGRVGSVIGSLRR